MNLRIYYRRGACDLCRNSGLVAEIAGETNSFYYCVGCLSIIVKDLRGIEAAQAEKETVSRSG